MVLAIIAFCAMLSGCTNHANAEDENESFQSVQAAVDYLASDNHTVVELQLSPYDCFIIYSPIDPSISLARIESNNSQYYIKNRSITMGYTYEKGNPTPVIGSYPLEKHELCFVWSPAELSADTYQTTDISNYQVIQVGDSYFYYELVKSDN